MIQIPKLLSSARKEKNLSLDDISKRTKIRKKYLISIENGDWDSFPAPVYLEGFVASYADAVGLDSNKVMKLFKREFVANYPEKVLPEGMTKEVVGKRSLLLTLRDLFNKMNI